MECMDEARVLLERLETLVSRDEYTRIREVAAQIADYTGYEDIDRESLSEALIFILTPERLSEVTNLNQPEHRVELARAIGVAIPDDPEPWRQKVRQLLSQLPDRDRQYWLRREWREAYSAEDLRRMFRVLAGTRELRRASEFHPN